MPNDDTRKRLDKLEWTQERQEERMNSGAESFSSVRQALEDNKNTVHALNQKVELAAGPRPLDLKWLAGFSFTILCVAGSALWAFAKYPDSSDFSQAQEKNAAAHKSMDVELDSLKEVQGNALIEQKLMQQTLKTQEKSLGSIDKKIDKLLLPPRKR